MPAAGHSVFIFSKSDVCGLFMCFYLQTLSWTLLLGLWDQDNVLGGSWDCFGIPSKDMQMWCAWATSVWVLSVCSELPTGPAGKQVTCEAG